MARASGAGEPSSKNPDVDGLGLLRAIVEHIPHMIFVKDAADLRFVLFNRAGEELLGVPRDQMLGKSDHDLFPLDQAQFFTEKDREVLRGTEPLEIEEEELLSPSKGVRLLHTKKVPIVDDKGQPRYLLGISEDITERTAAAKERSKVRKQLEAGQRLEAVGRLAGGVAHDFNNLLTVIGTYSEMLLASTLPADPRHADMCAIRDACAGAASLTRQLLSFSRKQMIAPRNIALAEIVKNTGMLLERSLGEDIELSLLSDDEVCVVCVDPGQLEQVIMNLALNARDAMPEGGKLTMEIRSVELDEEYARAHPPAVPGRFAILAVSDTGNGMDEHTREHAFEPFFSTKDPGKGTGLGLATVYGIVTQSGGFIWVYSELGHGTQFKIFLPLVGGPLAPADRPIPAAAAHGDEAILVVEDASGVREAARRALELHGYQVFVAPTGEAAREFLATSGAHIDLLLTDIVMPGMNGRAVAEQITALRPDLKVLFMSGYTDDAILRHGVLTAGTPYLQKPFTPTVLARKVRETLDAK